jgi:hypothetical protein
VLLQTLQIAPVVTPKAVGLPLILLAIGHNFLTVLPLED